MKLHYSKEVVEYVARELCDEPAGVSGLASAGMELAEEHEALGGKIYFQIARQDTPVVEIDLTLDEHETVIEHICHWAEDGIRENKKFVG